jgi:hypothetical protein
MNRLPSELVTGDYKGKKINLKTFTFIDPFYGTVSVPAGFIFDGASIPRVAWSILGVTPYDPKIFKAAIIHDWLYSNNVVSKKNADSIFSNVMVHQKLIKPLQVRLIHTAVKIFGGKAYRRVRESSEFLCPIAVKTYINCNHD